MSLLGGLVPHYFERSVDRSTISWGARSVTRPRSWSEQPLDPLVSAVPGLNGGHLPACTRERGRVLSPRMMTVRLP